ncbi:putative metallocarboxypeptidase ecm14 [Tulasnella sp. JGI-2019a]|nr:putative metallocarboxypeptidase ecm14 [Tulasnella sp. JGI-2019a]
MPPSLLILIPRLVSTLVLATIALGLPHDTILRSDVQKPLNIHSTSVTPTLDVRRYLLHSAADRDDLLVNAIAHDLDIWSLTQHNADVYFPNHASIPSYFDDRNYTAVRPLEQVPSNSLTPARAGPWNTSSLSGCTFHNVFHTQLEIHDFIHQLAEEYSDFVELITLGRTSEGRAVQALSISKHGKGKTGKKLKKRLVIQGAQHAREWIATSTALYIAHALLVKASDPRSKRDLLKKMDFTIIPLPNPDGYVYTWEHDRLWYKNRADVGDGEECKGIDLNRNWGYAWMPPTEPTPCSHWYPGSHPFEALEPRAVAAYIHRTPNIKGFLDLRSYGQMIMHPFSHSCDHHAKDEENLLEAALGAAKAMSKTHGIAVRTGSLCDKLYSAPGNVVDWMYGEARITISYSVMLRDTGTYGFLLPSKYIRPVGEETADMVDYLAKWIKKHKV